jgi:hypothetical protein
MTDALVVPTRFRGPLDSGNGGWVSAMTAAHVDGDAEVTLRRPPPLETPLPIEPDPPGVRLCDGEELVATAAPVTLAIDVPAPITPAAARRIPAKYGGEGIVAECFSCGRDRTRGDGLCLYPGEIHDRPDNLGVYWSPDASVGRADGSVPDEIVWAALDCPSGWVHIRSGMLALLGRMAAHVSGDVRVGGEYAVVAGATGVDGRKHHSVSALYDDHGTLLAFARATWVQLDQAPTSGNVKN